MNPTKTVTVPSPQFRGWVEVDPNRIVRQVQKRQAKIEKAFCQVRRMERSLVRSFAARAYLWLQQDGKCPYCGQLITPFSGWSVHHVIPRCKGGSDALDNLQLLHPHCHRQLHGDAARKVA
ncbi:MAG: HNH endonuclease [Deltaproteobacteria bacterium]|nr:HNH endonuclease [Deltaproteobacteria bacterium]MBW1987596.1 HNH endonuclease [Deltaproteobacteria bacterium]